MNKFLAVISALGGFLALGLGPAFGAPPPMASGGGHAYEESTSYFLNGEMNFAFTARGVGTDASGQITLQGTAADTGQQALIKATVVCLNVVDNTADVEGVITGGTYPSGSVYGIGEVGDHVMFRVVDNGEGAKATGPDLVSHVGMYYPEPLPNDSCLTNPIDDYSPMQNARGNIQVKPAS